MGISGALHTGLGFFGHLNAASAALPCGWEPDAGGPAKAPLILGSPSDGGGGVVPKGPVYPREPRYNLAYTKLAEYRLKQYESFLTMPRSVVE